MSRYTARVRADAGLAGHFACDSIHVDAGGNLSLNLQRSADEVVTIARFQHGHWSSYDLDVTPEPEPEPPVVTVSITVQGSVASEQDLAGAIRRALHRPPGQAPYAAFKR